MDILESYIKVGEYLTKEKTGQIRPKQKGFGFALKAHNGNYLTTNTPTVTTKDMSKNEMVDEFSQFYIVKIDRNTIALKTDSDKYLSRFVLFFILKR